jgi:hypothetical protein
VPLRTGDATWLDPDRKEEPFWSPGRAGNDADMSFKGSNSALFAYAAAANSMPTSSARDDVTEPKIPPWALIIFNPMSWNSGK